MKRFLPALLSALLFTSILYSQSLIPFRDGTRWGYCNPEGKIILPCIYTKAFPFNNNEAIVVLNDKYGLISPQGKWLLPAAYDSLGYFEPLAIFKKEGKYGLLDKKGTQLQPATSDRAEHLKSGFYLLTRGPYSGLVNSKGELVLPVAYRNVFDFREGRALVWKEGFNEPWSIINEKGDVVFQLKPGVGFYNNNEKYFRNGVLQYRTFGPNEGGGYYDSLGNVLVYQPGACCNNPEERKLTGMYRKGLFPAEETAEVLDTFPGGYVGKLYRPSGYCDSTGNFVLKPVYSEAGEFENGLALVKRVKGFGLIDTRGREIIPLKFEQGRYLSSTRLVFRDKEKAYLYNTNGNLLATYAQLKNIMSGEHQFGIGNYSDGIAIVKFEDGQSGYIDSLGKFFSTLRFNSVTPFSNGLAVVTLDNELSYINKKGQLFYRRPTINIGNQQWDVLDLNTRVFANGDSVYTTDSPVSFIQKGLEKKPACYLTTIKTAGNKTREQVLYNRYALQDPRKLAPTGWEIASEKDWNQLIKQACHDSIAGEILSVLGFRNQGMITTSNKVHMSVAEGLWWCKPGPSDTVGKAFIILVRKPRFSSEARFTTDPFETGMAVKLIRIPASAKPVSKPVSVAGSKPYCDSLLAIARVVPVTVPEKKPEAVIKDYASQIAGTYKEFTCVLTGSKEVTFTKSSVLSHRFIVKKVVANYIDIDFEFDISNAEGGKFFVQFVMQMGEPGKSGTGAATRTNIPLYRVESKAEPYKPGVPYFRGENVRGSYCPETRTITISGDMVKMYNSNEVNRVKYRITGVK